MKLKSVPHVQHDYFSPFNQSDHCFLALSSSMLKISIVKCVPQVTRAYFSLFDQSATILLALSLRSSKLKFLNSSMGNRSKGLELPS